MAPTWAISGTSSPFPGISQGLGTESQEILRPAVISYNHGPGEAAKERTTLSHEC